MKVSSFRLLLMVGLAAGCAHSEARSAGDCLVTPECLESAFPLAARGTIRPQLGGLAPARADEAGFGEAGKYYALTERACQCRAARSAGSASVHEQEAQAVRAGPGLPCRGENGKAARSARLRRDFLTSTSLEEQNLAAGNALNLYFRLAEAEARWDLLAGSLGQVEEGVRLVERLRQQGLPVPPTVEAFRGRLTDLRADRIRLYQNIERLNSRLRDALGLAPDHCGGRFWPADVFPVIDCKVNLAGAVAYAHAHRPQLVFLRELRQELDSGTRADARRILAALTPLAGLARPAGQCPFLVKLAVVLHHAGEDELETMRRQVDALLADRERAVAEEVYRAAMMLQTQARVVAWVNDRARQYLEKLREAEGKKGQGVGAEVTIILARLDYLKGQDDLIKEVMAWHQARVQLKQAQGVLAEECSDCRPASCPGGLPAGEPVPVPAGGGPQAPDVLPDQGANAPRSPGLMGD